MTDRPLCRHCRINPVGRPRGLCWSCYHTPGVTALYPSTSRHANRMAGRDHGGLGDPPREPTPHLPGTAGKVDAMAERLARGEELFHGRDARWGD